VSPPTLGGVLGLLFAAGVVVTVRAAPPMRPIRLADRMAPYLGDSSVPSALLAPPSARSAPFLVARRIFGPSLAELVSLIDRFVGGRASVRRRLAGLSADMSVEEFRIEQVLWGTAGTLALGGLAGLTGLAAGSLNPVLVVLGGLAGMIAGVLARDWRLSRQLSARETAMLAEFPVFADLLALSVVAGEAPTDALARACRLTHGELARDLGRALGHTRTGTPLTAALTTVSDATTLEPFARFVQGLVVGIERGTPLADVLRAQAVDVREMSKRALLEAGGRKEISMMLPVVFLILPITVLFALYPGLLTLTSLAG
jgi:tight adherence protein C